MHNLPALRLCLTYFLGLCLLASQVLAGPLNPLVSSPIDEAPTKQLNKRGILEDLYKNVPAANKVNTGNAIAFELYPEEGKQAALYAPTEFYGCTLVVIVNGHGVIIGHFAQEKLGGPPCMEDQTSVDQMIDKLQNAEADVDVDHVPGTRAWIIYSDDTSKTSPGYKAIMDNLTDKDLMDIPAANISPIPYRRSGGGGTSDKLVVQWSPRSDGTGATLNVYIRSDIPIFTENYDCNGNPVSGSKLKARAPACAPSGASTPSKSPTPPPNKSVAPAPSKSPAPFI